MHYRIAAWWLCAMLVAHGPVRAQPLVIDGEEIAGAELVAAAKQDGRIVYDGTSPEDSFKVIAGAFTKETGIPVTFLRLTSQVLFPRVMAEHAAGKLDADIVDLTDLTLVHELVDAGILSVAYRAPSFNRLAGELRDDQGRWYAFIRPTSAIVVNTALVREADYPKSWFDMLDPKWRGRIGLPSIDAGGSSFSADMYQRDVIAPDYWNRLAALKPRVYPSIAPTYADLIRGETAAIIGGPETAIQQLDQGAPLKVIFPVEGISSFPIAGGLYSGARRPNAAKLLMNWMLSRHGGAIIATTGAFATHPDAPSPNTHGVQFPPAEKVWNIPLTQWIEKRERYSQEWRDLFAGGR